jgi:hypothetical protein
MLVGDRRDAPLVVNAELNAVSSTLYLYPQAQLHNYPYSCYQDEARPICIKCQKRPGAECDVSERAITFIPSTIVKSRHRAVPSNIRTCAKNEKDCMPKRHGSDIRIPPVPALCGAMEIEITICYSMQHLSRGRAIAMHVRNHSLRDIIKAGMRSSSISTSMSMSTSTSTSLVFPKALLSYSHILFGTTHNTPRLTETGYTHLNTTYRSLHAALSHPSALLLQNDILISIATLAILECLVPTGPNIYLSHMLALEHLLSLRDPRVHCSRESVDVYKSVQPMVLFACLKTGRASVLAGGMWQKVVRGGCTGGEEGLEQDLFGVLADLTVLCVERDKLLNIAGSDGNAVECDIKGKHAEVRHSAEALHDYLTEWKEVWDIDHRDVSFKRSIQNDVSSPFPAYDFATESTAVLWMLYNTALIHVLELLESLPLVPSTTKDQYSTMARLAAIEICRCIPGYTRIRVAQAHPHSSPVTHWAVATAWKTLRGNVLSVEEEGMMELLRVKGRQVTARGLLPD